MKKITQQLTVWYAKNRISYPWRRTTNPYEVWLSEILLQQTRIPVVINFYEKILNRYSTLAGLARAKDSDFIALWSGMGYYRRAHNMLQCARAVLQRHGGIFPGEFEELIALPGIGRYTAGALRNICFGKLTPAIDGNIRRVLARLEASENDLERTFMRLGAGATPGDFFQSLMELGETICLPNPRCHVCPVRSLCKARNEGIQNQFPVRKKRKETAVFHWYLLVLNSAGSHYYAQNTTRPFLKNAWIFPDLLCSKKISLREQARQFRKDWGIKTSGLTERKIIQHAVTFRKIFAHILLTGCFDVAESNGKWLGKNDLEEHPTSSITVKVLRTLQIEDAQPKTAQQSLKQR